MTSSRYSEERIRMAKELFAIDVDAEIRKLSLRRQKTKGESAVELIQFASSMNPSRIDIDLRRRCLVIQCQGASFDDRIASSLATIMDPAANSDNRHKAVVSLEDLGGLAMLTAFESKGCRVSIEWRAHAETRGFLFEPRCKAKPYRPTGAPDFQIDIRCHRKDFRSEIALIKTHSRFSNVPIFLGGKRVSRGIHLTDCLVKTAVSNKEFEGAIGVPKKGDLFNLTILANGIVVKQNVLLLTSGIALDAVIEKRREVDMNRVIDIMEEKGTELLAELKTKYETMDTEQKPRVRDLLLEYCIQTRSENHVRGMKLFNLTNGRSLSLDEIETISGDNRLFAISSEDHKAEYELISEHVLVLGELERRFIEMFLDRVPFSPPPLANRAGFELRLTQKIKSVCLYLLSSFPAKPGRVVPDDDLEKQELAFLDSIRKEFDEWDGINICMAENQRRLITESRSDSGTSTYYISRSHKEARRMMAAVSKNQLYRLPSLQLLGRYARFRRTGASIYGRNRDA